MINWSGKRSGKPKHTVVDYVIPVTNARPVGTYNYTLEGFNAFFEDCTKVYGTKIEFAEASEQINNGNTVKITRVPNVEIYVTKDGDGKMRISSYTSDLSQKLFAENVQKRALKAFGEPIDTQKR